MSRHRAPQATVQRAAVDIAVRRAERSILQLGITDANTVVARRPLPPVPPVVAR